MKLDDKEALRRQEEEDRRLKEVAERQNVEQRDTDRKRRMREDEEARRNANQGPIYPTVGPGPSEQPSQQPSDGPADERSEPTQPLPGQPSQQPSESNTPIYPQVEQSRAQPSPVAASNAPPPSNPSAPTSGHQDTRRSHHGTSHSGPSHHGSTHSGPSHHGSNHNGPSSSHGPVPPYTQHVTNQQGHAVTGRGQQPPRQSGHAAPERPPGHEDTRQSEMEDHLRRMNREATKNAEEAARRERERVTESLRLEKERERLRRKANDERSLRELADRERRRKEDEAAKRRREREHPTTGPTATYTPDYLEKKSWWQKMRGK